VITECSGHLEEIGAKAYEDGTVTAIDESGRLVCLSIYLGIIRFLQLNSVVWEGNIPTGPTGRVSAKGKEVVGKRVATEVGHSVNMR
jgi:hypothetical protein